jgi:Predicted metal-dependent hydrolase of the TIM-barrel fold
MPLQDDMKLISTDDHVVEHPRVWSDRLPARYRDVGPRIVEDGGAQVWDFEGRRYPQIGLNAVAGRPREEYGLEPTRYDELRPGCYDPVARIADMDIDGVQAQLCFPTFPKFAGTVFLKADDKDLSLLCVQAYNDFMLDEWCGAAPDRLIPLVILPLWSPRLATQELERCAAKGAKAVSFPENPAPLGLPSFHTDAWDPVFAAAQDAELPLCMHFGSSGQAPHTADDAPFPVSIALFGCNSMYTTADLLFSRVFHKFDRLKVALAEGGIGWVPYMLERIDYTWERHRYYTDSTRTRARRTCSASTCGAASSTTSSASSTATPSASSASRGRATTPTPTPTGPTAASGPPRCWPTCPTTRYTGSWS